jgi:hypothetical protein
MKLLFENWRKFINEDESTRETFAQEFCDLGGFESGYWGGMPTSRKDYQDAIKVARPLKKLYNKHADRAFLNSLITVHWTERMGLVKILSKGSSKDELSCAAYLPGTVTTSTWGDYGVVVKGYISLLANDMNDLVSGAGQGYAKVDPQRTKSSGANKGVGMVQRCSDYADEILVFDKDDWKPRVYKGTTRNEAFVDNWKITAIISPEISHPFLKRIVHGKMNRPDVKIISPEQVGELK